MSSYLKTAALASALSLSVATGAFAHASFAVSQAEAESYFTAELRIPHGCDGKATNEIVIRIPEGFIQARPKVKPGWNIEIIKGDYQKSYDLHGKTVKSGPVEIRWTGGSIPDDFFDSVEITGKISGVEPGAGLAFVTTQKCGADGEVSWSEIAKDGQNPHELKNPAPVISIVAGAEHGHDHGSAASAAPVQEMAPVKVGDLSLSGGFLKGMLAGQKVAGGFLTVENGGSADDRLVEVKSPVAGHVEIHEMSMENDIMKMRELKDGLPVKAGEKVELAPGGFHLMFMDMKNPIAAGETVPVTFVFEKAGIVEAVLPVLDPRAVAEGKHK